MTTFAVEDAMGSMVVRAELASGIAQAAPWAPALDGILASQVWARRKSEEIAAGNYHVRALDRENPVDLDLPLARCPLPGSDQWHWLATCGMPEQVAGTTRVHTWTGRVDARDLEQVAARLPATVSARQGRYRARRMPLLVAPCRTIVWRAVGDPAAVEKLLAGIDAIGKKRSSGEGRVLSWSILADPGIPTLEAGHLHPDGSLGRPVPAPCQDVLAAAVTGGWGTAGLRPPYMHRSRQHHLVLPALLDAS